MVKVPPLENVHESIAVPLPVRLVGDRVQWVVSLEVRLTVPVNPFMGAIGVVTVLVAPAFTVSLVVLVVIVKSVMLNSSHALVAGLLLPSPLYLAWKL